MIVGSRQHLLFFFVCIIAALPLPVQLVAYILLMKRAQTYVSMREHEIDWAVRVPWGVGDPGQPDRCCSVSVDYAPI